MNPYLNIDLGLCPFCFVYAVGVLQFPLNDEDEPQWPDVGKIEVPHLSHEIIILDSIDLQSPHRRTASSSTTVTKVVVAEFKFYFNNVYFAKAVIKKYLYNQNGWIDWRSHDIPTTREISNLYDIHNMSLITLNTLISLNNDWVINTLTSWNPNTPDQWLIESLIEKTKSNEVPANAVLFQPPYQKFKTPILVLCGIYAQDAPYRETSLFYIISGKNILYNDADEATLGALKIWENINQTVLEAEEQRAYIDGFPNLLKEMIKTIHDMESDA